MTIDIAGASDTDVYRRAKQLVAEGSHDAAATLLRSLQQRQTSELGASHAALGRTLYELALVAFARKANGEAQALADNALDNLRKSLGPLNPAIAARLRELVASAERAGSADYAAQLSAQLARAPPSALTAVTIAPNASSLRDFGNVFAARGDFAQAERCLRAAVSAYRGSATEIFDLAEALTDLGEVFRRTGKFDDCESTQSEACALVHDPKCPAQTRSKVLSNYGLLNSKRGRFPEARSLFQQAIAIQRTIAPSSESLAIMILNLAGLHEAMADLATAERLYVESAGMLEQTVGVNHISFSLVATNLGDLYRRTGRLPAAVNLLSRAIDVRRHHFGASHPYVGASMANLGVALTTMGRFDDARAMLAQSVAILEALPSPGIDLPYAYQSLAVVLQAQRDWEAAETLLEKAIQRFEAALGHEHGVLAQMLSNLAVTRAARGRPQSAIDLLERIVRIENATLLDAAAVLSDRQRLGLIAQLSSNLTLHLAVVRRFFATSATHVRGCFEHVLARKAISAEIMAAQRASLDASNDAVRALLQRLAAVAGELGELITEGPQGSAVEPYTRRLAELQREHEALEAQVAALIPDRAVRARFARVHTSEVADALARDALLVEVVKSELIAFDRVEIPPADYCMFVLAPGAPAELHLVELGPASRIDELVRAVLGEIVHSATYPAGEDADPTQGEAGRALAQLVVEPLRKFLDARTRIVFSADGLLGTLPLGVLPFDSASLLGNSFEVVYVASGRDVLRFGRDRGPGGQPVVVFDPNFDLARRDVPSAGKDPSAPWFKRLAGTRTEGERVAALLGARHLAGDDALESHVKRLISPRILHIATHGYLDVARDAAAQGAVANLQAFAEQLTADAISNNALLRSGLALAGANCRFHGTAPPDDAEDGLLTAFDVTGMDLTETRLVVLSACVTGLGEIHPSEGALGLRRSFMIARAATVLATLWYVPDAATTQLMVEFYSALEPGVATAAALRKAQAKVRESKRNPYFWGGFVCYGDGSSPVFPEL